MPMVIRLVDYPVDMAKPAQRVWQGDPTKVGLTQLPVELQKQVLDHLKIPIVSLIGSITPPETQQGKVIGHPADFAPLYKANMVALARLSSCSSTFAELVQPLLYETVWVWDIRSLLMLLRSLMSKKSLRTLIRHFASAVPPAFLNLPSPAIVKGIGPNFKRFFANFKTFELTKQERDIEFLTSRMVGPQSNQNGFVKGWKPYRATKVGLAGFWKLENLDPAEVPTVAIGLIACICPNIETLSISLQETRIGDEQTHEREYLQLNHAVEHAIKRKHLVLQRLHTLRVRAGNYRCTVDGPLAKGLRLLPNLRTIEYLGSDTWHEWLVQAPAIPNIESLVLHMSCAEAQDMRTLLQRILSLKSLKVDFVPGQLGAKSFWGHCFLPGCRSVETDEIVASCQLLDSLDIRYDLTPWDEVRKRLPSHTDGTFDGERAVFAPPPPIYRPPERMRGKQPFLHRGPIFLRPDLSTIDFSFLPKLKHLTCDLHCFFGGRHIWLTNDYPPEQHQQLMITPLLPETLETLHIIENWLPACDEPGSIYEASKDRIAYYTKLKENVIDDILSTHSESFKRLIFTPDEETVKRGDLAIDYAETQVRFQMKELEFVIKYPGEMKESVIVYPGTVNEYTVKHWKWYDE
jgi:hypothetical protein